ncbi:hypothetical protein KAM481_27730 [Aeromonas caviae]|uniref:hypothetical protein n=1 Tax=Aeromonas caviae TaxID=648 RepID=UPI001FB99D70|nr:hypothetical protein [Aeromonas caviae]BDO09061.1 hypothetical protein KAM643c_26340 [Aeromonas caviae]GKR79303.1 hypothetical protein KAM481_27730 [Aeromonas caviae]
MEVTINKSIDVSVKELVESMDAKDIAELLDLVAHRFEEHYKERKDLAGVFAQSISETGSRFLAEICASSIYR